MSTTTTEESLGTRIEQALRHRFSERSAAAERYGSEFAGLWQAAEEHALGGKLIRPRLLLDLARALAPAPLTADEMRSAIDVAAHVELLHFAFLLHDDVIDGDLMRRRRPNLIGALVAGRPAGPTEPALHWARSSAILLGDLLLSSAVLGFARAGVTDEARERLLGLLEETIFETVAGEHADVALSDGIITPDLRTILSTSAYKTSTYSFVLPLRAAAVLVGSSNAAEDHLAVIGRHLGLAYQLQDDLLSVFGDPEEHGKDPFSDLREGKETAIIAYARMTSQWDGIELHFGRADLSPTDGAAARDRLRECGSESFVRGLVREHLESADAALREAEGAGLLPAAAGDAIRALASRVGSRSR
ncbi:polyprenyl synthetase family protein [Microbacterium maritypicum]|uniref:polyprenyl synthetase family protein n=1 Tax=Microbacterium maritypicum TaxID=33918 RepID=UPI001B342F0F|nr:polyprenyl synthetase family protein [Microbacterium liquefaciens]MBP5801376.1 polyprenyl synthetase family protein [Microbacterium liquefaciens]